MENQEVKYLLAIEKYRNITKAAESLYISQPALSRYLREKEKDIGKPLFIRGKNQLEPTELGQLYLSYAKKISQIENQCNKAIQKYLSDSKTKITFGLPSSRAEQLSFLVSFIQENNPDYDFEIVTGHSAEIWALAQQGHMDLVVTNQYDSQQPGICLTQEEALFCIPVSVQQKLHLAEHSIPSPDKIPIIDIHLLQNELFYLSEESNIVGYFAELIFKSEDFHPKNVKYLDNSLLAYSMAAQNRAVCMVVCTCLQNGKTKAAYPNLFRLARRYYNYLCLYPFSTHGKALTLPTSVKECMPSKTFS